MKEDDIRNIAAKGRKRIIEYAIRKDGSMPAKEFLDGLDKRDRNHLRARFQHLADGGEQEMNNDQVFKAERPPFWTFKRKSKNSPKGGDGMIRIPCFRIGNRWILTHGFWKPPQSEWPEHAFVLAEQIRQEFSAREEQKRQREK